MILVIPKSNDNFVCDVLDWLDKDNFLVVNQDSMVQMHNSKVSDTCSGLYDEQSNQVDSLRNVQSIWYHGGQYIKRKVTSSGLSIIEDQVANSSFFGALNSKICKQIGERLYNVRNNKIEVLNRAKVLGLDIPDTLITQSKKELISFFTIHNRLISKRIGSGPIIVDGSYAYDISKTITVDKEMILALPDVFGISLFQQKIPKKYEVRTIVFDGKTYSAAIIQSAKSSNSTDYRIDMLKNSKRVRIVPYKLPLKIDSKIFNLMKSLGLDTGSIDFIVAPDDTFFFLELNPQGQISFINKLCNYHLECEFSNFLKS